MTCENDIMGCHTHTKDLIYARNISLDNDSFTSTSSLHPPDSVLKAASGSTLG
jgi:hypothetical protein